MEWSVKTIDGYELRVRSALSEVLVALAGHLPELPSQPSRNQAEIRRVRQMLTFIQGHCTQPLRVEDIAASVFISRRECMRAFQNVLGISPIQYVLQLRVRKAKELLLETGLSLGEICAACGSAKVLNIALLGAACAAGALGIPRKSFQKAIESRLPQKFVTMNLKALELGAQEVK